MHRFGATSARSGFQLANVKVAPLEHDGTEAAAKKTPAGAKDPDAEYSCQMPADALSTMLCLHPVTVGKRGYRLRTTGREERRSDESVGVRMLLAGHIDFCSRSGYLNRFLYCLGAGVHGDGVRARHNVRNLEVAIGVGEGDIR